MSIQKRSLGTSSFSPNTTRTMENCLWLMLLCNVILCGYNIFHETIDSSDTMNEDLNSQRQEDFMKRTHLQQRRMLIETSGSYQGSTSSNDQSETSTIRTVVPSDYLIESAITRSKKESLNQPLGLGALLMARDHPVFEDIPEKYQPMEEWKTSHFPDINILGLPKAGTSHLYNIIASHPKIKRFHTSKEFCMYIDQRDSNMIARSTPKDYEFILQTLRTANDKKWPDQEDDGKLTVNGCLLQRNVLLQKQYLQRGGIQSNITSMSEKIDNAKYILILRDPADWLWSGFNYWVQDVHGDALPAVQNNWASAPYQYRSPELFHEYMLGGDRIKATQELFTKFRDVAIKFPYQVLQATSKENILLLKAEDLAPDVAKERGAVDKLAKFLSVSADEFDDDQVYSYSNCGDSKGEKKKCRKASNAYAIAGKRSMLEETRDLVYLHFAEECKFWADNFDVHYTECLAVREKYVGQSAALKENV